MLIVPVEGSCRPAPLAMIEAKFGVEAEYALIRPDGRFADFTNTDYSEVRPIIDALPDFRHPELRVGDAGIRVKNWYVEGDERFDASGRSTGMIFKGIEIRTPPFPTIEECLASLGNLRRMLADELGARGWCFVAIGFNPFTASYDPSYTEWEEEFHASHIEHQLPQLSTLSYGPDFNFSLVSDSPEDVIERVRRLTYYSPYIVPFSFSSPFLGGDLWDGLSYRTYRRTGPRPAALAHLAGVFHHPLVKRADPPSQHLRVEFKAFDMIADDCLLSEVLHLTVGVALADARDLPGCSDYPDRHLHQMVALTGFEEVHDETARVVAAAENSLRAAGYQSDFPLLREMLATRRTPAHGMRERFERTGMLLDQLPQWRQHDTHLSASPGPGSVQVG